MDRFKCISPLSRYIWGTNQWTVDFRDCKLFFCMCISSKEEKTGLHTIIQVISISQTVTAVQFSAY